MGKLLFKNKGIQFGALYNNFQQRLKKASNELSYVDYVKIMDSEKALRHYSDACFNDFISYQLATTRKAADKDGMIKSLISDEHKYATVINNLQHHVHDLANNKGNSDQKDSLSKLARDAKTYEARIRHLRQRCASLKATNADALKAVEQYKQLYDNEKKAAEAKPKVKVVKKPVVKTKTVYKPQPDTPQDLQSKSSAPTSQSNSNEVNESSEEKNPFAGPNEMQQQSDERAQHERAESDSSQKTPESSKASNADNDVYLRARRRAELNNSSNRAKNNKPKKNKKSSASQAPDISELRNKSYSLDENAADKAIQQAKDSVYDSDNNDSASDDDSSSSEKSSNSSKSSDSADSEKPSGDSSNGAPTLKM